MRISLGGLNSHANFSWSVFGGLKPYGLRWVWAVESSLKSRDQRRTDLGKAAEADAHAVRCAPRLQRGSFSGDDL